MDVPEFDHPAWITAVGTIFGYGIVLAALTVTMFLIPYLVFLSV